MRLSSILKSGLLALGLCAASAGLAAAAQTAQATSCDQQAANEHLNGKDAAAFKASCNRGALAPKTPTAQTPANVESRAVVAPSGADRTVRSRQCDAEADKKRLTGQQRKQFRLSCLATAGPTSEGETATRTPKPAKAIPSIGVNNYNKPAPQ